MQLTKALISKPNLTIAGTAAAGGFIAQRVTRRTSGAGGFLAATAGAAIALWGLMKIKGMSK